MCKIRSLSKKWKRTSWLINCYSWWTESFTCFKKNNLLSHVLTSKIILCRPKQKVEPNGLVLLAEDDLEKTHKERLKVGRSVGCQVHFSKGHEVKCSNLDSKGQINHLVWLFLSARVSPVKDDRFFHRVTKQLLNLIPLTEEESRSS